MRRTASLVALLGFLLARPGAVTGAPAQPTANQPIIAFLSQAIAWYRQQIAQAELANDPSDVVFVDAARRQARQVVQLAFAFARADVSLQPQRPAAAAPSAQAKAEGKSKTAAGKAESEGTVNADAIERMAESAASDVQHAQATVERLQQRASVATGRRRSTLEQQVAESQSELRLAQARSQALSTLAGFLRQLGGATGNTGLMGQIDELERSVPEAVAPEAAPHSTAGAATAHRAAPTGIVALASDLFALGRKMSEIHDGIKLTTSLRDAAEKVRAPLAADLRTTLQEGERLSKAPDTTDPVVLAQRTQDIDQLTAHFKAVSAALIPLGKAAVLLDAHETTLQDWHSATDDQYDTDFRALALHLALVAIAIAAILTASAFWRRATLRYVHDLRRRHQSLLLRRVVVAVAVALMILFSFVTELGSLATFAGFITAGLAVALQNVILSVAAYFFLIGRYGIRVGDRVQIAGVTGDVIDIGLVRLHLMELRGDGLPTGRVVVFSNAVLFQPTANFFKQIPGSNFTWHQVTLTISPETDYRYAERRLLGAVEKVYTAYQDRITREHEEVTDNVAVAMHEPRPHSQLRLSEAGIEMTIRFPVPLQSASEIDDRMTRALLEAVEREPRLKLVGSGTPTIQAAQQPATA